MKTAREKLIEALIKIDLGYYSDQILAKHLHTIADKRDRGLFTEIFYGVLRKRIYLDYIIDKFSKTDISKLDKEVLQGLRIGIYQLFFLDKIPERAAVFETVEAVKKSCGKKGKKISGFVNGILREVIRKKDTVRLPNKNKNKVKYLSIKYSHPEWLVKRWITQYGISITEKILSANNDRPNMYFRHNSLKFSESDFIKLLCKDKIEFERIFLPGFYKVKSSINPVQTEIFKKGGAYIQGIAAGLAAFLLDVDLEMQILDLAAAPGGKTAHIAEKMNNTGYIKAVDISSERLKMVQENIVRLGIKNVETENVDSRKLNDEKKYDRILADLPCSGLGLISSKPEIKWQRTEKDINKLADLQYSILSHNLNRLRVGGKLLYSTCTLNREENQNIINKILTENNNFILEDISETIKGLGSVYSKEEKYLELIPGINNTEGFFYARIKKIGE
ncbi:MULTISPECIES: 16S rRNA (cytosine(967)-C(5))-methyltransferase RsmB [unclassified Halanaerobium]|uniref:16S rRNA (cytosine(967)-C(5))-methyltransferase RsmB n=1 Tax=unclassified Halanaerobium TaxID=2641197 RepID=UPI000DF4C4B3|nr:MULTISPECIES: 16S rRNA (cytosine(967)-C(5))-methyltransferase RsmB [unclassified Halanaerobium]RCW51415.1 16S rRNA (cytosine967-C5)-methyltransferase [Halanaerobium sp. MA284_MarDTE_T2]RCW89204.1 16S rRNA (cytosine967-C5)-methyltransferase [Halanaerobium sp. DL-01]